MRGSGRRPARKHHYETPTQPEPNIFSQGKAVDAWLDARVECITRHDGPVVFSAPPRFGTDHLISHFNHDEQPLVWIKLAEQDRGDPIAQGNGLAEALRRALGRRLFTSALPFTYGVEFLRRHLDLLGPFTFALSGATHAPALASTLQALQQHGSRVLLAFDTLPETFVPANNALVLNETSLRVTLKEAFMLAEGRLGNARIRHLLKESQGAYTTFLQQLHETLNLPSPVSAMASLPLADVDHGTLLELLKQNMHWAEAIELAVTHVPHRVPDVLKEAGHVLHQRGLHKKLFRLLSRLPEIIQNDGLVLFWRLSAAARLGQAEQLRLAVERYLEAHDDPELRALYAGTLAPLSTREEHAAQAYAVRSTPLTLLQHGRYLRDVAKGAKHMHRSISLAERVGKPYEIVRNAGTFAGQLILLGRYREAVHWGTWALERFSLFGLEDGQRRLFILNNLTYARLLTGDTVGLEDVLTDAEQGLSGAFAGLSRLFRSTVGNYFVASGRAAEALTRFQSDWDRAPSALLGAGALNMVRALLECCDPATALDVAEKAYHLTQLDHALHHRPAVLAYGMALTATSPKDAVPVLEHSLALYADPVQAHRQAQASLYLARAYLVSGDSGPARQALGKAGRGLAELSATGALLLSGPETHFRSVWALWQGDTIPLDLRFLGGAEVWWGDTRLDMSLQRQELLVLLALHPEGLSMRRLELLAIGDGGNRNSLKTALTRLRKRGRIPITYEPYRLDTPFRADFLTLNDLLETGRVREAITLYRGPLLVSSGAPGIIEAREALEEALRQAALASGDPEVLLTLAERLGDDLELWEALHEALPAHDTRTPLVRARVKQVRKMWEG